MAIKTRSNQASGTNGRKRQTTGPVSTQMHSVRQNMNQGEKTGNDTDDSGFGSQNPLKQLFEKELKGIYSAENQLIQALPEFAKAAQSEELQNAFREHLEETKRHAERLEKIFNRLRIDHGSKTCENMQALIKGGQKIISESEESSARDAALIIGSQKIEHYEMAVYGSLCELADTLGLHKIADVLDRTLEEEETADHHLTEIAREVNSDACEEFEGELQY